MSLRSPRSHKLAERIFAKLCDEAGVVPNSPADDQNGWDFVVDFPPRPSDQPADRRPPGLTCLVQVKSTRGARPICQVKLSNALKFARHALPCFVVFVMFDSSGLKVKAIYLRHAWAGDIEAAMRAARVAEAEGRSDLHRIKLPLRFRADEAISENALLDQIETLALAEGPSYSAVKLRMANELGNDANGPIGRFNIDLVDAERFVDAMLGLADGIPITDFELHDVRFGIRAPRPLAQADHAMFSVDAEPHEECQVIVGSVQGGGEISLDGQVFVPGIPNLPDNLKKVRIRAQFVDLVVRANGECHLRANIDPEQPLSIEVVDKVAAVWSWLDEGALEVQVWARGRRLMNSRIGMERNPDARYWRRLREATGGLLSFLQPARWPSQVQFKVLDLMEGLETVTKFIDAVQSDHQVMRMGASEHADWLSTRSRYIHPVYLDLGDITFFALMQNAMEYVGTEGDEVIFHLREPVVLRRASLAGSAADNLDFMRAETDLTHAARASEAGCLFSFLPETLLPRLNSPDLKTAAGSS
ncbi:hypothetical protein [Phenylobacterium sp.]|uniref:hypothetical protein n=1 Tax=Phenylobacterium sp. TaxID=1871053 RepID=UPI002FC686D1